RGGDLRVFRPGRDAADFKTHENPNGIPSFSPGLRGTSYPGFVRQTSPTPTGLRPFRFPVSGAVGRNLVGVAFPLRRFPKVARCSQPWAGGHNPVGIARTAARRWLAGQYVLEIELKDAGV